MNEKKFTREHLTYSVDQLCDLFNAHFPEATFSDQTRSRIALNVMELGSEQTYDAMTIALEKPFLLTPGQVISYFFGICRNKRGEA